MAESKNVINTMAGKDYPEALRDGVIKGVAETAIQIEDQAVALVPVKNGRLRGSITWAMLNDGDYTRSPANTQDGVSRPDEKYTAHVGTNVEYATYVEYGTSPHYIGSAVKTDRGWRYIGQHPGTKPQAYLRPAVDIVRAKLPVRKAIKKAMEYENRK